MRYSDHTMSSQNSILMILLLSGLVSYMNSKYVTNEIFEIFKYYFYIVFIFYLRAYDFCLVLYIYCLLHLQVLEFNLNSQHFIIAKTIKII